MPRHAQPLDGNSLVMTDHRAPSTLPAQDEGGAVERWYAALLRVPLLPKLIVADLVVNLLTFVALRDVPAEHTEEVFVAALLLTMLVNGGLVWWALLPL